MTTHIGHAVAVFMIGYTLPARADTARYAVVIGHNNGASGEQLLRYAESDAQRFADLLGDVGGVPSENQVVLRGKSAEQVRRAIIATNERIRISGRSSAESVLFVYYSGHGDAEALHLGDSRLALPELESLVRGSPAGVRVLVIDACRSGSLTRVKGGRPGPPLRIAAASPPPGEGMIVLTASTLSEDAQESDQLGGSFFTHYLLSGLRGAADENGDQLVTVAEAFSYTRDQTIVASSRTLAGTQHPTFHYDLRGRADLTLADLSDTTEHGELTLPPGAIWLVMRTVPSRSVVGEIAADAPRRTLSLRSGSYAIRGRTRDALLEGTVNVAAGVDTKVVESALDRMTYAALVRKGNGEILRSVDGPFAALSAQVEPHFSAPKYGPAALLGVIVGWTWIGQSLTISPRISVAWSYPRWFLTGSPGPATKARLRLSTVDVRATRAWQVGRLSVDLGFTFGAGGVRAWQDTASDVPSSPDEVSMTSGFTRLAHIDVTLGTSLPLWGRSYIGAEIAAQTYVQVHRGAVADVEFFALNTFLGFWL